MKAVSKWVEGFKSVVDNGRKHAVVLDLPESQGGTDFGATALELTVMALAGCISTIFAMVAKNSGLEFSDLKADVDAEKGQKTIEKVTIKVHVKTDNVEKAKKVLDKTLAACPVGLLYDQAGVDTQTELIFV